MEPHATPGSGGIWVRRSLQGYLGSILCEFLCRTLVFIFRHSCWEYTVSFSCGKSAIITHAFCGLCVLCEEHCIQRRESRTLPQNWTLRMEAPRLPSKVWRAFWVLHAHLHEHSSICFCGFPVIPAPVFVLQVLVDTCDSHDLEVSGRASQGMELPQCQGPSVRTEDRRLTAAVLPRHCP